MSKAFDKWWADEGSTRPEQGDDVETHTMKKCRIAWDNGAYVNEVERDVLQAAKKACVDIYMDLHVSEMEGKPEHLKQAWSVGQEFYLKNLEGKGDE